MHETTQNQSPEIKLQQLEAKVVARMSEVGAKYSFDFWPENMGMILAAEGVEGRFSLGSTIIKAVWDASINGQQIDEIKKRLENKYRLTLSEAQDLEKDLLALGRLITRVQIDLKEIFAQEKKSKIALMECLMDGFETILNEYEKELAGQERLADARGFLELNLTTGLTNFEAMLESDWEVDKDAIAKTIDRYRQLLTQVQKIDPHMTLSKERLSFFKNKLRMVVTIDIDEKMEIKIATDEEFDEILRDYRELAGSPTNS